MAPDGDVKVRGEVVAVLFDGHVKELKKNGTWCAFTDAHGRKPAWEPACLEGACGA